MKDQMGGACRICWERRNTHRVLVGIG